MELLGELTPRETDRLWWRLVRSMTAVSDEIDALELCPSDIRDNLYGPRCLEHYRGMLADLADLADNHVRRTVTSWANLLADTTEGNEPQWPDSESPTPTRRPTWMSLAARMSLARSSRRLRTPR